MDTLRLWAIPLEPDKINGEVVVIMGLFSEGCINLLPCSGTLQVPLSQKLESGWKLPLLGWLRDGGVLIGHVCHVQARYLLKRGRASSSSSSFLAAPQINFS